MCTKGAVSVRSSEADGTISDDARRLAAASRQPSTQDGFTLIELVIGIVVLAVGLTGAMLVFTQTVARSADPMLRQQALALAEGYMDEVLGKANLTNCSPDPASGSTRATWLAVGDYDGLDEQPPKDIQGQVLANLADYRVQISTSSAAPLNGVNACRVVVTVTHATDPGARAELIGWRTED
ncbi:MAG: prepilin-type N-terminal cleavage/methylation domain-containing protein [Pseudomonadota bacterium]